MEFARTSFAVGVFVLVGDVPLESIDINSQLEGERALTAESQTKPQEL